MAPRRREDGQPPPVYDDHGHLFTVAVNYGGTFIGAGINRSYKGGVIDLYDFCETEKWNLKALERVLEDTGIVMGEARVLWCLTGQSVRNLGLADIMNDHDCMNMAGAVAVGHKELPIYVDHAESILGEKRHLNFDTDFQFDSDGSDFEEEIVDSDYDLYEGDDDLYEDCIEEDEDIKGKKLAEEVELPESDHELELPESDDEQVKFKFKNFTLVDMANPQFKVGQTFAFVELLRKAIREYSCRERVNISMPTNDKNRIATRCADCIWYLWASWDSRSKCFLIKRHEPEHTCERVWKVRGFTYKFIEEKYIDYFRADEGMNIKKLARVVQKEWNMTPSRPKLRRARRLAMSIIYGDEVEQYNLLWQYAVELRRANPGSTFFLNIDSENRFNKCYWSLGAIKRGFLEGCWPVICLDGCHLKTKFGGQLLVAVGMDSNDCIYPVAFSIVEVEDTTNWRWFLQTLKKDLGIHNTSAWTIMSDKQKVLIKAVSEIFPESEHRFCVRHLWQNFNQLFRGEVLKNQLWKIARTTTIQRWEEAMEEMKLLNKEAYDWLEELPPNTWVRAFQSDWPKCDILLNNNCEVFNKYILEARELPVLTMIDKINQQLMTRVCSKQDEGEKFPGPVCPKKKLNTTKLTKLVDLAAECYVLPAGSGVFDVRFRDKQYIVELLNRSCTCRRWDLSGIPCHHAIACMRHERISPTDHVHPAYSVQRFRRAYAHNIMPCRDKSEWAVVDNCPQVAPPHYEKKVGRPKKNRRKQPEEKQSKKGGLVMSKHGVIIHCSHCGNPGHNKSGCSWYKAGMPPKKQRIKKSRAMPDDSEEDNVPVITQVISIEYELIILLRNAYSVLIYLTVPAPNTRSVHPGPLPDSTFITAEQSQKVAPSGSSSSVEHNIAAKAEAMKMAKLREHEEKKEASVAAKLKKAAEAKQVEYELAQQRRLHAQQKKEEAAELRKLAASEKKEALFAARQQKAAQKEAGKARKAAAKQQEAAQRRAPKPSTSQPKNVSMFDELRG
ncbi:hypothetical protein ACQ4PT_006755 [Festuca glaucescens]